MAPSLRQRLLLKTLTKSLRSLVYFKDNIYSHFYKDNVLKLKIPRDSDSVKTLIDQKYSEFSNVKYENKVGFIQGLKNELKNADDAGAVGLATLFAIKDFSLYTAVLKNLVKSIQT